MAEFKLRLNYKSGSLDRRRMSSWFSLVLAVIGILATVAFGAGWL